jgi:hypothetical protein
MLICKEEMEEESYEKNFVYVFGCYLFCIQIYRNKRIEICAIKDKK